MPRDRAEFHEVAGRVRQDMHHPFLKASHIEQSVSRFHFDTGRMIMEAGNAPADEIRVVLEAVLLLHEGLSIHDRVDDVEPKSRQLMVLAGDYESSQYYSLLAGLGNHQLLEALSEAVVSINEAKCTLTQLGGTLSRDAMRELLVSIQGELLFALGRIYTPGTDWQSTIRRMVEAYVTDFLSQSAALSCVEGSRP